MVASPLHEQVVVLVWRPAKFLLLRKAPEGAEQRGLGERPQAVLIGLEIIDPRPKKRVDFCSGAVGPGCPGPGVEGANSKGGRSLVLVVLGIVGDQVNDPAQCLATVQSRGRTFDDLDPFDLVQSQALQFEGSCTATDEGFSVQKDEVVLRPQALDLDAGPKSLLKDQTALVLQEIAEAEGGRTFDLFLRNHGRWEGKADRAFAVTSPGYQDLA